MQAEGVAGKQHASFVVIGKDRVGPVQIGRADKLQKVAVAQIKGVAIFHDQPLKGAVHQIFKEGDRHLSAHHDGLGG